MDDINKFKKEIDKQDDEFIIKKEVKGEHSLTPEEANTLNNLNAYVLIHMINKDKLNLLNKPNLSYYIMEDGSLWKYDKLAEQLYTLDMDNKVWQKVSNTLSNIQDGTMKCQELLDFEDYYDNLILESTMIKH